MTRSRPRETLVSEPLTPVPGALLTEPMTRGEPALPTRFTWRGRELVLTEVLETEKGYGPCPSGERYLRRHRYRVRTEDGAVLTLYFERTGGSRPPSRAAGRRGGPRWWLQTIVEAPDPPREDGE
jgi:hypothetical protein